MDGVIRASRYAFGPNRLHYCGPDANREMFNCLRANQSDRGLKNILSQFQTMYPYLLRIANANKIADPFEPQVVEAYWLGNNLLENISKNIFYRHLLDEHKLKKRLDAKSFGRVVDLIRAGALPHHSFHVLAVWKRTGNEEKLHTLESMDSCLVSWGRVVKADGPFLTVGRRPLVFQGNKLTLGEAVLQKFMRVITAPEDIEAVKEGDIITIHWQIPCEVISSEQAANLEKYTLMSINLVNRFL